MSIAPAPRGIYLSRTAFDLKPLQSRHKAYTAAPPWMDRRPERHSKGGFLAGAIASQSSCARLRWEAAGAVSTAARRRILMPDAGLHETKKCRQGHAKEDKKRHGKPDRGCWQGHASEVGQHEVAAMEPCLQLFAGHAATEPVGREDASTLEEGAPVHIGGRVKPVNAEAHVCIWTSGASYSGLSTEGGVAEVKLKLACCCARHACFRFLYLYKGCHDCRAAFSTQAATEAAI